MLSAERSAITFSSIGNCGIRPEASLSMIAIPLPRVLTTMPSDVFGLAQIEKAHTEDSRSTVNLQGATPWARSTTSTDPPLHAPTNPQDLKGSSSPAC